MFLKKKQKSHLFYIFLSFFYIIMNKAAGRFKVLDSRQFINVNRQNVHFDDQDTQEPDCDDEEIERNIDKYINNAHSYEFDKDDCGDQDDYNFENVNLNTQNRKPQLDHAILKLVNDKHPCRVLRCTAIAVRNGKRCWKVLKKSFLLKIQNSVSTENFERFCKTPLCAVHIYCGAFLAYDKTVNKIVPCFNPHLTRDLSPNLFNLEMAFHNHQNYIPFFLNILQTKEKNNLVYAFVQFVPNQNKDNYVIEVFSDYNLNIGQNYFTLIISFTFEILDTLFFQLYNRHLQLENVARGEMNEYHSICITNSLDLESFLKFDNITKKSPKFFSKFKQGGLTTRKIFNQSVYYPRYLEYLFDREKECITFLIKLVNNFVLQDTNAQTITLNICLFPITIFPQREFDNNIDFADLKYWSKFFLVFFANYISRKLNPAISNFYILNNIGDVRHRRNQNNMNIRETLLNYLIYKHPFKVDKRDNTILKDNMFFQILRNVNVEHIDYLDLRAKFILTRYNRSFLCKYILEKQNFVAKKPISECSTKLNIYNNFYKTLQNTSDDSFVDADFFKQKFNYLLYNIFNFNLFLYKMYKVDEEFEDIFYRGFIYIKIRHKLDLIKKRSEIDRMSANVILNNLVIVNNNIFILFIEYVRMFHMKTIVDILLKFNFPHERNGHIEKFELFLLNNPQDLNNKRSLFEEIQDQNLENIFFEQYDQISNTIRDKINFTGDNQNLENIFQEQYRIFTQQINDNEIEQYARDLLNINLNNNNNNNNDDGGGDDDDEDFGDFDLLNPQDDQDFDGEVFGDINLEDLQDIQGVQNINNVNNEVIDDTDIVNQLGDFILPVENDENDDSDNGDNGEDYESEDSEDSEFAHDAEFYNFLTPDTTQNNKNTSGRGGCSNTKQRVVNSFMLKNTSLNSVKIFSWFNILRFLYFKISNILIPFEAILELIFELETEHRNCTFLQGPKFLKLNMITLRKLKNQLNKKVTQKFLNSTGLFEKCILYLHNFDTKQKFALTSIKNNNTAASKIFKIAIYKNNYYYYFKSNQPQINFLISKLIIYKPRHDNTFFYIDMLTSCLFKYKKNNAILDHSKNCVTSIKTLININISWPKYTHLLKNFSIEPVHFLNTFINTLNSKLYNTRVVFLNNQLQNFAYNNSCNEFNFGVFYNLYVLDEKINSILLAKFSTRTKIISQLVVLHIDSTTQLSTSQQKHNDKPFEQKSFCDDKLFEQKSFCDVTNFLTKFHQNIDKLTVQNDTKLLNIYCNVLKNPNLFYLLDNTYLNQYSPKINILIYLMVIFYPEFFETKHFVVQNSFCSKTLMAQNSFSSKSLMNGNTRVPKFVIDKNFFDKLFLFLLYKN